jgi:16S rRNA (cytosine967-C5)-methyltransferase
MRMAYGTVQRRATLDHVAGRLLRPPLSDLDPEVLAALRLGLFQLLFLDTVPDHAAVGESVELAKPGSPGGARLVNAVLRRAARDGHGLIAELDDDRAESAAVAHSVPEWLAEMWWRELGEAEARALLRAINDPPESAIRVNSLVGSVDQVSQSLPVPHHPAAELPEGLVLDGPFDAQGSPLWRAGAIMPQSRASMLVSRILAPEAGQHVLDLCAAPGGKTTHLAALLKGTGGVLAVEQHPGRAAALERTCLRMHAGLVSVQVGDAAELPRRRPDTVGIYDRVLVDPPCSGLGTVQSRPDLRWRASPAAITDLAGIQARILAAGAAATRPGGTLVYSVCTISEAEGSGVVDDFLNRHPEFTADELGAAHPAWAASRRPRYLQLLPHRHRTDGFFIARLRRNSP